MDQPHAAKHLDPRTSWYRIRIRGRLDRKWSTWFDGMSITTGEDGTTILRGPVGDQAALHGLIQRVRDLGLTLLEITHEEPGESHESAEGEA